MAYAITNWYLRKVTNPSPTIRRFTWDMPGWRLGTQIVFSVSSFVDFPPFFLRILFSVPHKAWRNISIQTATKLGRSGFEDVGDRLIIEIVCLKVCWKMDGTENSEDTFLFNCKNANCMNCSLFFRSEEEYFWGTLKHPKHPESCQTWRWTNQVTKPPKKGKLESASSIDRIVRIVQVWRL